MSRFKRLNVPDRFLSIVSFMKENNIPELSRLVEFRRKEFTEIAPVFNKNGYYLDRKEQKTWVEIDGFAWLYSTTENFYLYLEVNCGRNRLSNDKFLMLAGLISSGIINHKRHKDLYRMYLIQDEKRQLRIY